MNRTKGVACVLPVGQASRLPEHAGSVLYDGSRRARS